MKKNIFIIALVLAVSAFSVEASEHEAHKHSHGIYEKIDNLEKRKTVIKKSLDKKQLLEIAKQKVHSLVVEKKISKSWLDVSEPVITRTKYKFVNDYMVVFHNPKIKKKKYKNLYIFVNSYGDVQGANYSGR